MTRAFDRLRSFKRLADSPTYGADIISLLSAWKVGFWFILFNCLLLLVLGVIFFIHSQSGFSSDMLPLGVGKVMAMGVMGALAGLVSLLVPIRMSGTLEGPRWQKYFDQLLLSGISPARYFSGKLIGANLFYGVMLLAALPYMIFTLGMEGADFWYYCKCAIVIGVYVNILALGMMLLSCYVHEALSVFIILIACFFLGIYAGAPGPVYLSVFFPSRVIMSPAWEELAASLGRDVPWEMVAVKFRLIGMNVTMGPTFFYLVSSIAIIPLLAVMLSMGPMRSLVRENGTYGEVVTKGHNSKKLFRRKFFMLKRQSELSFFFENRSPFLTRWEGVIRYGALLIGLFFLTGLGYGTLHLLSKTIYVRDFFEMNLFTFSVSTIAAIMVFSCPRNVEATEICVGKRKFTAGYLSAIAFILFLGINLLLYSGLAPLRTWLDGGCQWLSNYSWRGNSTMVNYQKYSGLLNLKGTLLLMALMVYSLYRWICMKTWGRVGAAILVWFVTLMIWSGPFIAAELSRDIARDVFDVYLTRDIVESIEAFSPLSCFKLFDYGEGRYFREIGKDVALMITYSSQVILLLFFAMMSRHNHRWLVKHYSPRVPEENKPKRRRWFGSKVEVNGEGQ